MFNKDDAAAAVMSFKLTSHKNRSKNYTDGFFNTGSQRYIGIFVGSFWTAVPDFLASSPMCDLLSRAARPTCVLMRITQP